MFRKRTELVILTIGVAILALLVVKMPDADYLLAEFGRTGRAIVESCWILVRELTIFFTACFLLGGLFLFLPCCLGVFASWWTTRIGVKRGWWHFPISMVGAAIIAFLYSYFVMGITKCPLVVWAHREFFVPQGGYVPWVYETPPAGWGIWAGSLFLVAYGFSLLPTSEQEEETTAAELPKSN